MEGKLTPLHKSPWKERAGGGDPSSIFTEGSTSPPPPMERFEDEAEPSDASFVTGDASPFILIKF